MQGPPLRSKLSYLADRYLKRVIQTGSHDSIQDAQAAMDLVLLKIRYVRRLLGDITQECTRHAVVNEHIISGHLKLCTGPIKHLVLVQAERPKHVLGCTGTARHLALHRLVTLLVIACSRFWQPAARAAQWWTEETPSTATSQVCLPGRPMHPLHQGHLMLTDCCNTSLLSSPVRSVALA